MSSLLRDVASEDADAQLACSDFVTYLDYKDVDAFEGWVWRKGTGYARMVAPANRIVIEFLSDGQTFYWIEMDELYEPTFAELWTSPVVADATQLQPQKRADVALFGGAATAGEAHIAYGDRDGLIHVYRLSDGVSWTLTVPNEDEAKGLPYVDATFVIVQAAEQAYRIRFSDLPPD